MKNPTLKRAFYNAFGTTLYVIILVVFMFSLQRYSGVPENEILIPIAMLLLFVCSAAITGGLVFGKPVMLYIDGRKKEAVSLLLHTIAMLVLITIVFFVSLFVYMNSF